MDCMKCISYRLNQRIFRLRDRQVINMTLGQRVKKRRIKYELTQKELAERIGSSRTMIYYIETDKKNPSLDTAIKLADALHCTVDELVKEKVKENVSWN